MEIDLKNDITITVDTIKEILEKKFPYCIYEFKKPVFDARYLKVIKDNLVGAVISIHKGKLKVKAFESNAWSRSVRQTIPIVGALTESKFIEFEKLIAGYLQTYLQTKNNTSSLKEEKPKNFSSEDHSKYMPKY